MLFKKKSTEQLPQEQQTGDSPTVDFAALASDAKQTARKMKKKKRTVRRTILCPTCGDPNCGYTRYFDEEVDD